MCSPAVYLYTDLQESTPNLRPHHAFRRRRHVRALFCPPAHTSLFLTPTPSLSSYGPIFIGVIFNTLLYGIMITQTYIYFTTFKQDRTWMKAYVGLLFLCDTVNSAFDIAFLYIALINNFVSGPRLSFLSRDVHPSASSAQAIIGSLVQLFFAWRVKVLTNSTLAVVFITACAIVSLLGGMGTAIATHMMPEFAQLRRFKVIVIIWLVSSAMADCLITFVLVRYLRGHKTGFGQTNDFLNKIIRITVQTGLITALCAIIDLVTFLLSSTGIHLTFNLALSKLYTNSLMSTLNSRAGWSYGSHLNSGHGTGESGNRRNFSVRTGEVKMVSVAAPGQVYVDVESHQMVDVTDAKGIYPPVPALNLHDYTKKSVVLSAGTVE
ncbi:uncharacterized protein BXZ73DRAFT_46508 [Epithele typhae]|uniref:uncharacterized protein n=1 Tax=Epithele typhae TaxID=378194 RepID=UPI002007AC6A|nr:uncharacterized protein BXZ73DRAFT_46508 [Epithele typhae]KAH9933212.1 hypothetical protein BXZ73DRAFT_46508 [Epithele typhae]